MKEVHIKEVSNGYIVEYDGNRVEVYGGLIEVLDKVEKYFKDEEDY